MDIALCEAYLDMPAAHWKPAREALAWMENDTLGEKLLKAALEAFTRGDRIGAAQGMRAALAYVRRSAARHAQGVYPAIFAAALPQALARMEREKIDEQTAHDTMRDYGIWARAYEKATGHPGFAEMEWEVNFFSGHIVKLGRLQYERGYFEAPYTFYRVRESEELILVPNDGIEVDEHGFIAHDAPVRFTTRLRREADVLYYHAVDTQRARITPERAALQLEKVRPLLTTGLPALNIHIPEAGPLEARMVEDSLARAHAFFASRGIENEIAICESWLLDPALLTYGAQCANICDFQKRFMKYPDETHGSDAVSRVFGRGTDARVPERLREDTRLQRGLKNYLCAGGMLRDAGGVIELRRPL